MNRTITLLLIAITIFISCNHEDKLATELNSIANSVNIHIERPSMELQKLNYLLPERYHEMATLYSDLSNETGKLSDLLDSIIAEDNSPLIIDKKRFNRFYELIDSIYIPRLDTVRTSDIHGKNYRYTQLTLLDRFITPLKEQVRNADSFSDLELIRLYLFLIEREAIDFIHDEGISGSIAVNYIKPITIKTGNKLECYLAAVDTCNEPYVLIGKFENHQIRDQYYYCKPLEVIDTLPFYKEKATIDLNRTKGYDAVIFLNSRYGNIEFKVDK